MNDMSMPRVESILHQLAQFIAERPLEAESPELAAAAGRIIADSLASIVSGAGSELAASLLAYANGAPGSTPILASSRCASAEVAAMVNGAFGHALEFDDVFSMLPGHPGVVIVAALASDVAHRPHTAREVNHAFTIGYEVCARFGIALSLEHHRVRGFHATGTLGLFGAVAALARLRGFGCRQTSSALSVAASFASGLLAQIGTPMKSLHAGWAARNAVTAVQLVEAGITGAQDVLESPKGFFNAYGTGQSALERLVEGLGQPWAILSPGVSLKKYPCCFAAHRGIEAILLLRQEHGVGFDEVKTIECRLPPKGLINMIHRRPSTGLQAKFSMEYCFLATLMDGFPDLASFTDKAVQRPLIQANLHRVVCIEDMACEEGDGEASGSVSGARGQVKISLQLKDGRSVSQAVAHAPGTPARPLSEAELEHKFRNCAQHAGLDAVATSDMLACLRLWQSADDCLLELAPLRTPT